MYAPAKRGKGTSQPVERFDKRKQVKEVAVIDAVPDDGARPLSRRAYQCWYTDCAVCSTRCMPTLDDLPTR